MRRDAILIILLLLTIGLFLFRPPVSPITSDILKLGLGSESYFAIDKATVTSVFAECDLALHNLADQVRGLRHAAFVLSWIAYILGIVSVLSARAFRGYGGMTTGTSPIVQPPGRQRWVFAAWVATTVVILLMGLSARLTSQSEVIEKRMYVLRASAAYTRLKLEVEKDPAEAQNTLESLRLEVGANK